MVCAAAAVANVANDMAMNNTGTADTTRPDDDLEDMCFLGRAHSGAGFTTPMQPRHRSDAGPPTCGRVPCGPSVSASRWRRADSAYGRADGPRKRQVWPER